MELIEKTWNEFPDTVRFNLVNFYLADDKLKQVRSNGSVIQNIWMEYDLLWFSRANNPGGFSYLVFTEEQWMMFLLRWS